MNLLLLTVVLLIAPDISPISVDFEEKNCFADLKKSHKKRMLGIDKPFLALSLMLLAALVASISTSSNKEEKILMVVEGRCRGRLIRVSRSECTGLFMDPTFRFREDINRK